MKLKTTVKINNKLVSFQQVLLKYFLVPEITYWYTCKLFKWFPELLPLVSSYFLFFRFKHFIQLSFPPEPRLAFIWILCVHISWWNTNKILCKFLTKISLPLYVNFKVLSPSTTICVYCIKDSVFVSVFVCVCLCTKLTSFLTLQSVLHPDVPEMFWSSRSGMLGAVSGTRLESLLYFLLRQAHPLKVL